MHLRRVHHVSFAVRDLAAARRFYAGILGLEEIPRPDFGFPGAWFQLGAEAGQLFVTDRDGDVIELIQPGGRTGAAPGPRPSTPADGGPDPS